MAQPLATPIIKHRFQNSDRLFFDTNIWFFIHGPQSPAPSERSRVYSGALNRALKAGSTIEVNALILSEFVNLVLRTEYRQSLAGTASYKEFRATAEYRATAEFCAAAATSILQQSTYVDFNCDASTMLNLIEDFGADQADFNDALIVHHCRQRDLILVTDDGDFRDSRLQLLSHNPRYF